MCVRKMDGLQRGRLIKLACIGLGETVHDDHPAVIAQAALDHIQVLEEENRALLTRLLNSQKATEEDGQPPEWMIGPVERGGVWIGRDDV